MATGLIGALRITLGIDTSEFQAGTSRAQAEMRGFQRDFERMGKKWQNMGRDMTQFMTVPIAAMAAGVLKMAGDFEASMIKVGISTEASAKEMKIMSDMARKLGADTIFSAKESADSMDMLAKAGVKTTDIINGAAKATVDLAAAAGSQLEPAAAAISDTMSQFNLTTKELPLIVNQLTGAVNESKLSFDDFVLAAGQAGGVAGSAGVEFKDFATALAGTSSMFASGSDAGTSFKTFLQRLVPDTKKAAKAMEDTGFNAFDASGKMKSLRDIAEQLQTQFGGMSEEARAGYFKEMFGQDAIRTAIGLMKLGGEGFDQMQAKIAKTDAAEQAAKRMQGFNAQMEQFKGAVENLAISIGESGFLQAMTALLTSITDFINEMAKASPEATKWGLVMAGIAAAMGPLTLVFGTFIRGIGFALPLLVKLGPVFTALGSAIGYLIPVVIGITRVLIGGLLANPVLLGAAALIGGIYLAWKNWDQVEPIIKKSDQAVAAWGESVKASFADFIASTKQGWENIKTFGAATWEMAKKVGAGFADMASRGIAAVINLANGVKTWLVDALKGSMDWVVDKAKKVGDAFFTLYDRVVGHSYIPDMVEGIRTEMAKLEANMVAPAVKGTNSVAEAFKKLQSDVSGLLARLFPEEAAYTRFLGELKTIEQGMKKLGFTAEQTAEAVRRLKQEYAAQAFGPEVPLLDPASSAIPDSVTIDYEKVETDLKASIGDLNQFTKNKTAEMIQAWANLASNAIGSVRTMVAAFKSGDILGGIQGLLGLVTNALGALRGLGVIKGGTGASPGFGGPGNTGSWGNTPGFSTGGSFKVGGVGGVDSQLVQLRATPGEMVDVRRGDQARKQDQIVVHVKKGEMFDVEVVRLATPLAEDAAQRGAVGGANISARNTARRDRSALRG